MQQTIGALRTLLTRLYHKQASDWSPQRSRIQPSPQVQELYEQLKTQYWWSVSETELDQWFSPADRLQLDLASENRAIYLPPLQRDSEFVPVLSLCCDLSEEKTCMSLRVMLVRRANGDNRPRGVGFRFESPHSEGRHGFYHAQLVQSLGWGPAVECPDWLPCTQPSFPVTACCPVTLVLTLLISLYGKHYWRDFFKDQQLQFLNRYLTTVDHWQP